MDRFALIARKQEVRHQLERVNRQLEAARNAADPVRDRRRIAQLEQQLQTLMAEEYALRLAIDRNR